MNTIVRNRLLVGTLILAGCNAGVSSRGNSGAVPSAMTASGGLVRQVAERVPVSGSMSQEIAAVRPIVRGPITPFKVSAKANAWKLQATLNGAIIHDIAFPSATIGYAAGEAGQVWKTTDGGAHWANILNQSYPYYYYGVDALTTKDVVISGFIDQSTQSGGAQEGIIRWSSDGGSTWSNVIDVTPASAKVWADRVRFKGKDNGVILLIAGLTPYYTSNGGQAVSDWNDGTTSASGGWFGAEYSFRRKNVRASGTNYCTSTNSGESWTCGGPIDPTFDGETFFSKNSVGWVGGGEISPSVAGWLHVTTDGGKTWSGRTLNAPFPVREIYFVTPKIGWAAGGNAFSAVGGIYFSSNGGQAWSADLNSGHEMGACDARKVSGGYRIWCAGFANNGGWNTDVYTLLYKINK